MRLSVLSGRRGTAAAIWGIALLAACVRFACSPPWADDLIGGDEGYYGTMARNVLASPAQVLSPSLGPLGAPGDKPPLVPLLIGASLRVFDVQTAAVRVPSLLCGVLVPALLGLLLWWGGAGATAAMGATLLFATLPWFADAARVAAAEPPLTVFGMLALVLLVAAPHRRARAAAAGALLGLGFLCKLWLVAPLALAAAVIVVGPGPEPRPWPHRLATLALMTAVALAVAALHLAAVAVGRPQDLEHWRYIYLGRSLVERVSGEGYASYWTRPAGAYWASATRAFGLVLPFVALGVADAWRRRHEPLARALLVWAAGVLLLSCFRVQAGGYAYVVLPAWAALAALGADALAARRVPVAVPLVAGALLSAPLLTVWGGAGLPAAVWAGIWGSGALFAALAAHRASLARPLAFVAFAFAVLVGGARTVQRLRVPFHTPGYATVAADVAPFVAAVPPGTPCVLAPEAPVFAFHLFRTAAYWATPDAEWTPAMSERIQRDPTWRVFVVDTTRSFHGGYPDEAMLAWLERETDERPVTAPGSPLRVFVRRR